MPTENYCSGTEDHEHEVDFYSVKQADVGPSEMLMDVTCIHCGQSGAFRIPEKIDW